VAKQVFRLRGDVRYGNYYFFRGYSD